MKGILLTIFLKRVGGVVLKMVKKRLGSFLGSKSPYALFSIKKSPEQIEDAAWGSRKR